MRIWFMVVALSLGTLAQAQLADIGLVNMVSGNVSYAPVNGTTARVTPYMRVREGDRFRLEADARLRVVFFEGARQERWQGPSAFRAARAQGEAIEGKVAEVSKLPATVPQRIARIPELMQNAKLGGIQVRGARKTEAVAGSGATGTLEEARSAYAQLRAELPADDVTPELFLYSALQEHGLYRDMLPVVEELRRKQPASEDFKAMESWVRSRLGS